MPIPRRGFQEFVNRQPPPAALGDWYGTNPRVSVIPPPKGFVAASDRCAVGRFAFFHYDSGLAANYFRNGSVIGFIHKENQANLYEFLEYFELVITPGTPVTGLKKCEVWAQFASGASIGQKVYADAQTGLVTAAATGTGTQSIGFTASIAVNTGVMTVTGAGTGNIAVGMTVVGAGVPPGTFVTALGTGTGGTGTYQTNLINQAAVTSQVMDAYGKIETSFTVYSAVPVDAAFTGAIAAGTGVLTVSSLTSGVVEVGQYLNGVTTPALVPNNLFITGKISGTGGNGTYQTNYIGPAVASQLMTGVQGKLGKISNW